MWVTATVSPLCPIHLMVISFSEQVEYTNVFPQKHKGM